MQRQIDIIQVLRFLAAMMVVGVHLPPIGMGHFGVDLFFVISGFIMAYTTAENPPSATTFLRKRIVRVVPLYWVMTLLVFAVMPLMGARSDSLPELVQSLLFLPFDNDGQGHVPVLFVGWTLNYEMLFYTLFALALALGARIAGTALMIGAVVLTCMALAPAIPIFALEAWASPILFEFVFGMAIWAFLSGQGSAYQMSVMTSMIVLCIGLCAMTESWRAVTSGLPAAILVWAALRWFGTVRLPGAITILGGASYALYLTHAFVIGAVERTSGPLDNLAMAAGVSVICVAVSLAVYFWVERPMNELANTPRTSPGLHP